MVQAARARMGDIVSSTHLELRAALYRRSTRIYRHGERVGLLCVAFGDVLGLEEGHIAELRHAAELHDIGKLAVPLELLEKRGALDQEEWQVVRQHPKLGYHLLHREQDSTADLASIVALQHHESWDGSGYPDRLRGEAISLEARIVTLCDVYDALREERAYKPALSHDQALHFMLHGDETGGIPPTMFDPALLAALKANSEVFRATYDDVAS